ncbi:hypothetical protein PHLCEN_2v5231 [Hermanssonia centrifuga]|uniref:Uncharacterized protein n=1 Tax=Hermanssonia centrifuga TaxID=98765 RepID=A0A2R6P8L5_9APHY|nr:hypothetical protein PHLCEN_2v5231 [Hermanssonia centrifuga]
MSRHDGKALERFVSVVVAITQTAQTFPSAVEMISGLYIYEPSRAWPYNGNPRVLIRTVQALCSLLPNLRSLELMDVMLDSKGSPSQSPVKLFTLDRLVLKLDILEVSSEILTILRLFSQVGSLKIHCHFGTRVKDFPFAPTGSPVSRTLLASADEFTNSVQRGRGLEVAALSLNMDTHGGFYLGLLKKTGLSETVEDLTVYCRTKDDVESLGAFLANDSGCDTLHRLSVDLNLTVEDITFGFRVPGDRSAVLGLLEDNLDWVDFERSLAKWSGLREIVTQVTVQRTVLAADGVSELEADIRRLFRRNLPSLDSQEFLKTRVEGAFLW